MLSTRLAATSLPPTVSGDGSDVTTPMRIEAPGTGVGVAVAVGVGVRVGVTVGVGVTVAVAVTVFVAVGVGVTVGDGVAVRVSVGDGVAVAVGVCVAVWAKTGDATTTRATTAKPNPNRDMAGIAVRGGRTPRRANRRNEHVVGGAIDAPSGPTCTVRPSASYIRNGATVYSRTVRQQGHGKVADGGAGE